MNFFDEMEKTIMDVSQTVTRKAREFAETGRLKNLMHTCEEVMEQKYLEIGRAYYKAHKDDAENEYAEECKAITDAKNGLAALQEQLDKVGSV